MSDAFSFEAPDTPAPIREAATVIVLREGVEGPEALLLQRHSRSGFAADAWVFPGGVVDEADGQLPSAHWNGIDLAQLAPRFNATEAAVLALHVAAVRETFEESGLLLATTADGSALDVDAPEVRQMRNQLADREHPAGAVEFNAWLAAQNLILDLGALEFWARWITPVWEKRRYDTRFFLARAPRGQIAAFDDVETTGQLWIRPDDALTQAASGELHMIYPTIKNLEELGAACAGPGSVEQAMSLAIQRPTVDPILPHFEVTADGYSVLHPGQPGYPLERYADELGR